MGDGDDFPVVVNGGLLPFDVSLWQLCCLQSNSISSAGLPLPKSGPFDVVERTDICSLTFHEADSHVPFT